MKQLMRRLTALLLAMAMVMSFAITAAAAESNTSGEDSSSLVDQSEQEVDPGIDAQDLSSETTDLKTDSSQNDADASVSDDAQSQQEDADKSGDSSQADQSADQSQADQSAQEPQAETSEAEQSAQADASQDVEAQDDTAGWAQSGDDYTLNYTDSGAVVKAENGLFALPQMTSGGITCTAGVYEFKEGKLVVGAYTSTVADQNVTVLDANLAKVAAESRHIAFSGNTAVDGVSVTAGAALFTGKDVNTIYYEGAKFNGFYRANASDYLYGVVNGEATLYSGLMVQKDGFNTYLVGTEASTAFDALCYVNGVLYTGFYRAAPGELLYLCANGVATVYGGCMKSEYGTFVEGSESKAVDELWYVEGLPFTGFYENPNTKVMYLLNAGVIVKDPKGRFQFTGLMEPITINGVTYDTLAQNNLKQAALTGLYYQIGTPLTGIPSVKPTNDQFPAMHLYKNGVAQQVADGWYKAPRAKADFWKPHVYYYFKNNVALTGDYIPLKAIQEGKYKDNHTYYYCFRTNGTLVTNLYRYKPGILKTGKFRIYSDHTTYTCTILMYNTSTKKYDIPVKSFVVAMSKSKSSTSINGTKYGDYALAGGHSSWYLWTNPRTGAKVWYSSSVHIWGSGSMFHSSNYKNFKKSTPEKTRLHNLKATVYNKIGTAVTMHCVRAQTVNVRLITAMFKNTPKKRDHGRSCSTTIRVFLTKSNTKNCMPFGQMTMLNNFDINGYLLQKANTGYGKDMSFDPTDHMCEGDTIYISKKKTSKKKKCTKVKMIGYNGYDLFFEKA